MFQRFRQRRVDEATRLRYRETFLASREFVWPVFLTERPDEKTAIPSLPGVFRFGINALIAHLRPLVPAGLGEILIFGVPDEKGIEQAWDPEGIVQRALPVLRAAFPELRLITDVCLCSYTADGHCHVGDNDQTCEILARVAVSHAVAGAQAVAPSDMMDGRVWHIDRRLRQAGLRHARIIPYSAKYASGFYGPFREAADCAPKQGDRKTYQMDPANAREALEEIKADLDEGADAVVIKPALPYLDVISQARQTFARTTIYAYQVSGEFVMLKQLLASGAAGEEIVRESLLSIKRAGADKIISYFTPEIIGGVR